MVEMVRIGGRLRTTAKAALTCDNEHKFEGNTPATRQGVRGRGRLAGVDMLERICEIEGCKRKVRARGWCRSHYDLYLKHGDPLINKRPDLGKSRAQRFWPKVDKNGPLGCWTWMASLSDKGYGQFIVMSGKRGYPLPAHRIAWEFLRGDIPEGLVVDHLCRTRACVNPDHLELVTNEVNILRGIAPSAINKRKTHCIRGHAFTPENTYHPPKRPDTRQCRKCVNIRKQLRSAA